jgi:hypothetical protein
MNTLLERVLERWAGEAGERPAGSIERIDVARDGALELFERRGEIRRWWRYDGAHLEERLPSADEPLPLARASAVLLGAGYSIAAWRPGRRIVLRHSGEPAHLLKGYRSGRLRGAVQRARAGAAACAAVGMSAPQVEVEHPEWAAYRMSALSGAPLELDVVTEERCFELGHALRDWQDQAQELEEHSHASELGVLADWERRHQLARGPLPSAWNSSLERLRELGRGLPRTQPVMCHRDLHEGQILITPAGFALLDFDLLCRADACLDPANLIAHLALRALQIDTPAFDRRFERLNHALLEGLDRTQEPAFWPRLRYYQAASLLRLTLVYSLRPRWPLLPARLADLARRCLDDTSI